MGHKISKEQIDPGVKDHIMSFVGDIADLETEVNTDIISAVNSLIVDRVDNAENMGKLANVIGEPVTANHSVDEVVEGLGEMLSTFKTNMMNNGVVVESGDKFKNLIDKISTMVEEGSSKGTKFASGSGSWGFTTGETKISTNLDFTPTIIICYVSSISTIPNNSSFNSYYYGYVFLSNEKSVFGTSITNITNESFTVKSIERWSYGATYTDNGTVTNWYAIGVGEEDTTLRDSLASILETKGVEVTEEDDMASLIGKVDSEFDEMENLKQDLIDILTNRGISVEEGLTTEELVNRIDEGTKFELKAGTTGTYLVTFVSSTVGTYSDGVERTINGTINFDKNKFRITGVSISYSTECEVTTNCITSLIQYRNDNAIKTHFSVDGKNTNDFGSWSGTVTDVQHGDIFKFVSRHQQVSTTSSAWIRHTLKITCVINI